MYTIIWWLKDDPHAGIHKSPSIFTEEEAVYLVAVANKHFGRAFHKMLAL